MQVQGLLVNNKGKMEVVFPSTTPVTKAGKKQFWFFDGKKPKLAVKENETDLFYKVN